MLLDSSPLTYPVEGYLPLQDPPTADLLKAHKLLGFIKNVLSTSIDLQVSTRARRDVSASLTCRLTCRLTRPSYPQEERLLEKDSALWRLQGDPTVLITLAHIFNHFAPLMVRVAGCPWWLAAVLLTASRVVFVGKMFHFSFFNLIIFHNHSVN